VDAGVVHQQGVVERDLLGRPREDAAAPIGGVVSGDRARVDVDRAADEQGPSKLSLVRVYSPLGVVVVERTVLYRARLAGAPDTAAEVRRRVPVDGGPGQRERVVLLVDRAPESDLRVCVRHRISRERALIDVDGGAGPLDGVAE